MVLLRNKHIRRPGRTPMGFLVCASIMGDSLSVTAAGRRSHKDNPGAGCRKSRLRGPEILETAFANHPEECMDVNRGHLRKRVSLSQRLESSNDES